MPPCPFGSTNLLHDGAEIACDDFFGDGLVENLLELHVHFEQRIRGEPVLPRSGICLADLYGSEFLYWL